MKQPSVVLAFTVALAVLPAPVAGAVETLTVGELAAHCRVLPDGSESADGQYCIRYIQGFIDGAMATDVRVMINVEAEAARKETFSERAKRTRSPGRDGLRRAAVYAEYCLGDPVLLREVVEKVVADLGKNDVRSLNQSARSVVYASLRKNYPCKKPDTKQ